MVGSSLLNTFDDLNVINIVVQNEVIVEDRPSDTSRESGVSESVSVIDALINQLSLGQHSMP